MGNALNSVFLLQRRERKGTWLITQTILSRNYEASKLKITEIGYLDFEMLNSHY